MRRVVRVIDEFRLFVAPIILRSGKPLFRRMKDSVALRLSDTRCSTFRGR
jgi:dihydrofolate reductase